MTKCSSKSVENQKQKQSYEEKNKHVEKEITGIHNDQHNDDIEMKP